MHAMLECREILLASDDETVYLRMRQLLEQIDPEASLYWTHLKRENIQQVIPRPYTVLFIDLRPFTLQDLTLLEMLEKKSQNARVIFLEPLNDCAGAQSSEESLLNLVLRKGACDLIHMASLTRGALRIAIEQASGAVNSGSFGIPPPALPAQRTHPAFTVAAQHHAK